MLGDCDLNCFHSRSHECVVVDVLLGLSLHGPVMVGAQYHDSKRHEEVVQNVKEVDSHRW